MSAKKIEACQVETEFINEWANCQPLDLKVDVRSVGPLGNENPDMADVTHVLRTGRVIISDMLGQRGLWTIIGETTDDDLLELEVIVASEESEVELRRVTILTRSGK